MNPEKLKVVQEFLKCPANRALLEEYHATNSEEIKLIIDNKFKKFYQNFRILSYLIKVVHYESKHFDRKVRDHRNRYQLTLTDNIDISPIYYEKSFSDSLGLSEDILDHISNDKLFNCLRNLTGRQKEILSLVFVRQMTDKEIGQYLGITPQAVSKTRRNVIKYIRKELTYD
ncbi:sigma-70 family RNA polymerase sigma factor [Psychrobacillus vulpis]|uniref:Sigma-70 family RNA polymerase sigma factor n=1 Tax=Psychrobacillus vulpis TaxID=2325572 RepID=A0A544TT54_9BACI|nr:sigma-70 family RNA polymerase sigma factor [Psychrobacillus vulpis]TQR20631.1 sigma-70 family RNA polymerase sigma factor [Psychrobacillus vulpis]